MNIFCTCFHEQDFLGFSLDGEQLGSKEYTHLVLVEDTKFSSKLVVSIYVLTTCV